MCQAIKEMLEDERLLGLEEDIEVIRPVYERAKKQVKEGNRNQ